MHAIDSIQITLDITIPQNSQTQSQPDSFVHEIQQDAKDEIDLNNHDEQVIGQCWVEIWYPIQLIEPRNMSDMILSDLKTIQESKQFIHSAIRTQSVKITQNQLFKNKYLTFSWDHENELVLSQFYPILNNFINNCHYLGHYCVNNTIQLHFVIEMFGNTNKNISTNIRRISTIETTFKYESNHNIEYPFTKKSKFFKSDFDEISKNSINWSIDIIGSLSKLHHQENAAIEFNYKDWRLNWQKIKEKM